MSGSATTQGAFSSGGGTVPSPLFHKIISVPTVTATTVTPATSGSIYSLASVGAALTLPPVLAGGGCTWRFRMNANNGTTAWTVTAPAGTLKGAVLMGATTAAADVLIMAANAGATVAFTATALAGDWVQVEGDGISYYVSGVGAAAASFAVA